MNSLSVLFIRVLLFLLSQLFPPLILKRIFSLKNRHLIHVLHLPKSVEQKLLNILQTKNQIVRRYFLRFIVHIIQLKVKVAEIALEVGVDLDDPMLDFGYALEVDGGLILLVGFFKVGKLGIVFVYFLL